ncbi:MAG: hypothetical protein LBS00_03805 [Synergistaceae bacterium]|jgi:2-oxoglutarate ferredoxin oxidoreductase subunit beta|nr:hypothetical protein [Synergistaceae bacterium]
MTSDLFDGAAGVWDSLRLVLTEMELELTLKSENVVVVSSVEMPGFLKTRFLRASYGCALSAATGIRAANPQLSVIAAGCDDEMYGAGGNHFLQTIRRNPNVTHIVYHGIACGGQKASEGTINPLTVALCCGASFVARGSVGELEFTRTLMRQALLHQGYALVDVIGPKAAGATDADGALAWLADNTYKLEDNIGGERLIDHVEAMNLAFEEPYPLGVLYDCKNLSTLEENLPSWQNDNRPLFLRPARLEAVLEYMKNL